MYNICTTTFYYRSAEVQSTDVRHGYVLFVMQRCELCPQREGALKRTDNGSE